MACDCDNYIDCGSPPMEVPADSPYTSGKTQQYLFEALVTDALLPYGFSRKITRNFSVSATFTNTIQVPDYFLSSCDSGIVPCGEIDPATITSNCTESCRIETNTPCFIDRQSQLVVWKNVVEEVNFNVTSTDMAAFRTRWGNRNHAKICIPDTVRGSGTEKYFMSFKGVVSELASQTYDWNPFPVTDMAGGNWGLYGNVVNNVTAPDTQNVACIIVWPIPGKEAMTFDNDLLFWGFYDYNAMDGGFVENSLPRDDGGKDFFYPYWCRSMAFDGLWRSTADERYLVIYTPGADESGTATWTPNPSDYYEFPFGDFLTHETDFIGSAVIQFSDRAGGNGIVYNEASMGDLFAALAESVTIGPFTVLYPMSAL